MPNYSVPIQPTNRWDYVIIQRIVTTADDAEAAREHAIQFMATRHGVVVEAGEPLEMTATIVASSS